MQSITLWHVTTDSIRLLQSFQLMLRILKLKIHLHSAANDDAAETLQYSPVPSALQSVYCTPIPSLIKMYPWTGGPLGPPGSSLATPMIYQSKYIRDR